MAQNVDFILNLNGDQARRVLLDLHKQGNNLFSKNGYALKLDAKGFNRSLDQATDRVLSFTAATTVLASAGLAMRRLASDAISVETAISKIQSILQATSSDLKGFTSSLFDLANKTGLGFADAATAAEEFSRQGLSLEKTLKATEAAMSLARVSGGNLTKTVQDLVAITSAFGNEALVYSEVADTLGALDAAFSTTTTGLAEGLARVASIANDVGISFKEMSALIAATKQVTGRSEAVIGNAFKSIFTNIGTDKVQEELRAIGVETRNLDGSFIDSEKVLANLARAYEGLTDAQQANITFKVAGKYNKNILQGAIFAQNQGVSQKALDVANNAGGSIAERLKTLNDTTETSIQRLNNAVTQLASTNLGGIFTDAIKDVSAFATNATKIIGDIFDKENPFGKALSAGISGVLKGPVLILGVALITKLIKKVSADLLRAGKTVFDTNRGFTYQRDILRGITSELSAQQKILMSIAGLSSAAHTGKKGGPAVVSGVNPNYFPNTIAGGGKFTPNTSPFFKPDRLSSKYTQPFSLTSQPSSHVPTQYLKDMAKYNANVAQRAATNKAGASAFSQGKLARIDAYKNTPLQGGFFNIAKREKEFARSQGVNENKQEVKDRIAMSRANRAERVRGGAFGASFLAPLVGSAVGSAIGGKGGRVAESAGQGLSIAAIGVALGGIAAPIGIAVGSFKLLSTVTEELFGNFEELNVKLTDDIKALQKQSTGGEAYLQAQFDFNRALETGEQILIEKSRKDLATAAGGLTGDFKSLLGITDPKKLTEANNALTESSIRSQAAILSMVNANDLAAKSYNGFEKVLSLFGTKKTLPKEAAAPLVASIVDSINLSKISGSIPQLQSEFINGGDPAKIQSVIAGLVPNFEILTTQFEGGAEALALLVFQALASKDSLQQFLDTQNKLTQTTRQLTANFEKAISRSFSRSERGNEAGISGLKSRVSSLGVFEGQGTELQQVQESFAKGLAEIAITSAEEQLGAKIGIKSGVGKTLNSSATSSADQAKISRFLEKFTSDSYNLDNLGGDLGSLGVDEVTIKAVSKSMEGFAEELDKSRVKADLAKASLKALTDAQLKKAKNDSIRNTFGNIDEDQSGAISLLSAGKAAERAFNARKKKDANAKLTEIEATAIRKGVQSQPSLGREGEFSDSIRILADKTKAQSVNQRQASSVIGDKIATLLGDEQFRYQAPSSKARNATTGKKIQASVLEGDFKKATGLVSDLIGVKKEDMRNLAVDISSEAQRNRQASPLANLETKNAQNLKQIAASTKISADAAAKIKDLANITPRDISLADQTKGFERDSRIAELTKSLESSGAELKKISDDRLKMQEGRNSIESILGDAVRAPGSAQYSSYADMAGPRAGERVTSLRDNKVSKEEADILRKAYGVPGGLKEKEAFLKNSLPPGRFDQLSQGIMRKLPSLDTNFNVNPLDQKDSEIKSLMNWQESEKKVLEESQNKAESSAKSLENSAAAIKTAAELFSQGGLQTIQALVGVNVAGANFVNTPQATEEITTLVKRLFVEFTKETTGKEPVLAPSVPTS